MKSKRLNIILHVFGFLILSVGILYWCQFFSKKLNEGFLSTLCGTPEELDDGRVMYLCDDKTNAETILADVDGTNFTASNDNVCIATLGFNNKYYTCYNRPPPMVYDSNFGVYQPSDPIEENDETPFLIAPNVTITCASYVANTSQVIKAIQSTVLIRDVIQNIKVSTTRFYNNLSNISTVKCATGTQFPNAGMSNFCGISDCNVNITTTINFFNDLPTRKFVINGRESLYSLNDILTAVTSAVNELDNLSTNILYPAYNNMNCGANPLYLLKNIK